MRSKNLLAYFLTTLYVYTYLTDARRLRKTGFRRPAEQQVPACCTHHTSPSYNSGAGSETTSGEWEKNQPSHQQRPQKLGRTRQHSALDMSFAVCITAPHINLFCSIYTFFVWGGRMMEGRKSKSKSNQITCYGAPHP